MKLPKPLLILGFTMFVGFATPSIAAPEAAPFPDSVSTQDEGAAVAAVEGQKLAGQALAQSLDGIWENLVVDDNSFFADLIHGLSDVTLTGFIVWMFWFSAQVANSKNKPVPWAVTVRPFAVMILFLNGGRNLAALSLGAKDLIYIANDAVLDSAISGLTGRQAIRQATLQEAYQRALGEKMATCNSEPEGKPRDKCREQAKEQIEKLIKQIDGEPDNALEGAGAFIAGAFQSLTIGALMSFSALFHGVLAYGLAVFATLSPITISLAMLPIKFNGFRVYGAGLMGAGIAIVYYSGASAATAALFATPGNYSFFILLSGIVNPFMAIGLGTAGFFGMYMGAGAGIKLVGGLIKR